jgi:hypothetical protein
MQEMQKATAALHNMLMPPSVIAFDFSDHPGLSADYNTVTARTAALLLHRVVVALIPTLYGEKVSRSSGGEYSCGGATLNAADPSAQAVCGTRIPLSPFSPACEFSKAPFNSTSLRHGPSVEALLAALTVPAADLTSTDDLDLAQTSRSASNGDKVVFSLQQYHCLLDLYGRTEEVQRVLKHHLGTSTCLPAPVAPTVQAVRTGQLLSSLNLSAHPTVCHVAQLTQRLTALKSARAGEDDIAEDSLEQLQSTEHALDFILLSIHQQSEAKAAAEDGEHVRAVQLLTEGLLEVLEEDHDDEDEDEGDTKQAAETFLPSHVKVALYTSRASYLAEAGDTEGALRDADAAIAERAASAAAYSLRCKLRLQSLGEEGEDGGAAVTEEDVVPVLEQAAEDGLLGTYSYLFHRCI